MPNLVQTSLLGLEGLYLGAKYLPKVSRSLAELVHSISTTSKYRKASKNFNKYRASASRSLSKVEAFPNSLDVASAIGTVAIGTTSTVMSETSDLTSFVRDLVDSSNLPSSVIDVPSPPYSGANLLETMAENATSVNQVLVKSSENLVNATNLNSQIVSEVVSSIERGNLINSYLLPQIFSAISAIPLAIDSLTTAVADSANLRSVSSLAVAQENFYNTGSDVHGSTHAVNTYNLTPKSYSDTLGDEKPIIDTPLNIRTKKDLGQGISHALENSTTAKEIGLTDMLPDFDMSTVIPDMGKLFKFQGIYDDLVDISSKGESTAFTAPDLKS